MSGPSLALNNLRAVVILVVLAFHSVLAYLDFLPAKPFAFDLPTYRWRSFPIVDSDRWFGFDLFCAWQDVFLMSMFFFLSGLFVWPSLLRKGAKVFLIDRLVRLGLPFMLVVTLLIPIAHYPTYLQTALDGSVATYWQHYLALPFWPTGPVWFLEVLMVGGLAAAALFAVARPLGDALARFSASVADTPARYFVIMLGVGVVAYVPLALAFTPWEWIHVGPISFQRCRPLHYGFYFFAGMGIGAYGLDRGLFAVDGVLVRRWPVWLAAALVTMLAWLGLTALTMGNVPAPVGVQLIADLSFVPACGASCLLAIALCLRFGRRQVPLLDSLRECAYGMYLVHYVFIVWFQYAMLGFALPAVVKATIVFAATLLASWTIIAAAIRFLPRVAYIIGSERRIASKTS